MSHYNVVLGDFNCAANKKYDRSPLHNSDDVGLKEFQNMLIRNDLCDTWRNQHPELKKYTFKRGNSKSRIDYILASNNLSSKLYDSQINHFPFSDHDIVSCKLKIDEIERGPGIWIMNFNTIQSDQFKNAFILCWDKWRGEKDNFPNILDWWDTIKMRIKSLTMEVSSNLNKFSKKQVIKNLEKQLEVLKNKYSENNKNDKIIKTIEESIRNYYKKEADAAKIRSRVKWTEEGEKSTRYFF